MSQENEKHRKWIQESYYGLARSIYFLSKGIIEELGEEKGKALIIKQIEEMGTNSGKARRKADESQGIDNGFKNYGRRTDSGDVVYAFAFTYSTAKASDDERIREFSYCPIAEGFKILGDEAVRVGELYCNNIDNAVMHGYNPDYMCRRESSLNLNGLCRLHFMKKQ